MTQAETEKIKSNVSTINKIGNNKLGKSVKKRMENNIKGAVLGGGIGIVLGIATRKNLVISGLIGLIIGRLILVKQ
jgi:hypothetical protein|tara:strand:+ start:384 stop:611 length:228 start_codon:yes stop_codon:yes gene_type:complete